jgi:predicted nucleic acid-binding protein
MIYLADTNVLLRFAPRGPLANAVVRSAVHKLRAGGHVLRAASQNLMEFWNVATRPAARNGYGLSPAGADRRLRRIEQIFAMLPDSPAVYTQWRRLVVAYGVSGIQVHDARLAAAMLVNGISHILTLNTADFTRYAPEGVVAVDPRTV